MNCNIKVPLQQIIDDVAEVLSADFIKKDAPVMNGAILNNATLRGNIVVDVDARESLCLILQDCGVSGAELEWFSRPTAAGLLAISTNTTQGIGVSWLPKDIIKGDRGGPGPTGPEGGQGEQGVSVVNVSHNADNTLTFLMSNNTSYTSRILKGDQGIQGIQGISAYQVAVDNGYIGNEDEWLTFIRADGSIQALQQFMTNNATTDVDVPAYGEIPSLQGYIRTMFGNGGLPAKGFETKAGMTTEGTTIPDGGYALVTDDTINNGLYIKKAGAWVKSAYDTLNQAKEYTNEKVEIDVTNTSDIVNEIDANGISVRKVTKEGKHFFIGLGTDLVSAISDSNQSELIYLSDSNNIFEHRDANGNITLKQDKYGNLYDVKIGNVTQTILDLKEKDVGLEAKHLAGKYADYVLAENMESYNETDYIMRADTINASGLFPHNVAIVRIPAITRIAKNKFLLFFEARVSQDDFGENSQGVATITVDEVTHLATLSNLKSLHSAYTDPQSNLVTYQNACAVKLSTGRIICLYLCRYDTLYHRLLQRHSDDDGQTWSAARDITSVKGANNWDLLCPTSQGLVKQYGQHKGRVVFPLWYALKSAVPKDFRAGYIYSDDNGENWQLGQFADYLAANELQIAEDLNGDMLFNIRLESTSRPNVLTRLSDKTKMFSEVDRNKELTNASIMCGFIQGENQYDLSANKFHLTACKSADRHELQIHTSYDGGKNWRTWMLPSTVGQLAAYSCIESLSASYKFVLWESDFMTNFKYAVVSLNNLIEVN